MSKPPKEFLSPQTLIPPGGAGYSHIAKVNRGTTVYYVVADLDPATVPKLRPIRDRYINVESPPASTFLVVARLSRPGWLIEIEAVAAIEE
jgi:enamine deaminase RidA (YjgF/YER057c/UK114 family)